MISAVLADWIRCQWRYCGMFMSWSRVEMGWTVAWARGTENQIVSGTMEISWVTFKYLNPVLICCPALSYCGPHISFCFIFE
jgi:hypothetical protein